MISVPLAVAFENRRRRLVIRRRSRAAAVGAVLFLFTFYYLYFSGYPLLILLSHKDYATHEYYHSCFLD
jgi:hypothetical protein